MENEGTRFTLPRFDDMHCHFRLEPLLSSVLPHTAVYASRGIVMPNTRPRAILSAEDVVWYHGEIERVLDRLSYGHLFKPLMTIEIRDNTTPEMVERAFDVGAVAGKVYPLGVTTNSDEGLRDFSGSVVRETFGVMEALGMRLLIHGELDLERTLVTKREEVFLPTFRDVASAFPDLKIVLEHVTSKAGVEAIRDLGPNIAATITAHHLWLTLNDVIGSGVRPHNACMPTPKDFSDRDALIEAATSGDPKFFLGSDTAPHVKERKECAVGACGVYSAPVLPSVLVEVFEDAEKIDRLEDFVSGFGADFYGLPRNTDTITLIREEWTVPDLIGGVVPFLAGQRLQWRLEE